MEPTDLGTDIDAQLARRRQAAARAWGLSDEVVLVGAGDPIGVPGRGDLTYPFRAHSEYFYLTDSNRPGGVLAFDPDEGWVDFQAPITDSERLWSGAPAVEPEGPTAVELPDWLDARARRPVVWLGSVPAGAAFERERAEALALELERVRRPKDPVELARMRAAAAATAAAFAAARAFLAEGVSERAAQIELETAALRAGADAMAFDTIVGSGPNAAVLHFAPSARRMATGELVLIDAGAECRGYASDITRTYCVGEHFRPDQRELHSVVHAGQAAALARCRPGTEWRDAHLAAALAIAEGLVSFGLLRGAPEALVESGAVWLFFPHGVGHLVGLGVRDAGGPLPERKDDPRPYPNLRIDLPLEAGMVVTVEPGLYFVPAILDDAERRREHRHAVDWDRVEAMRGFGGIRIEDDALITETGHEILTADVPL